MTKQEFINTLRISLNGKVSSEAVEENVSYYEDYINTGVRLGQSEADVLASLGDPRLIAKSIIEAAGKGQEQGIAEERNIPSGEEEASAGKKFRIPVWLWIFVIVFIIFLILGTVFSIVWTLLPILIPVGLVLAVIRLLARRQ